jgi:hypothetical protein
MAIPDSEITLSAFMHPRWQGTPAANTLARMSTPFPGDSVIIRSAPLRFDILDVESNEVIATRQTRTDALTEAAQRSGNVWLQAVDQQGRWGRFLYSRSRYTTTRPQFSSPITPPVRSE